MTEEKTEEKIALKSAHRLTDHLANASPKEVLANLVKVPIYTWNYTWDDPGIRHMGPMAQDFYAAFSLGADDQSIYHIDSIGVCLASLQALNELVQENTARIERNKKLLDAQAIAISELERIVGHPEETK